MLFEFEGFEIEDLAKDLDELAKKDALLAQERYQSLQMTVVELPLSYMEWQGETVVEATRTMAQALYPQYFTTEN